MSWYYGTFSCGHEGRVNIIGPTKDRQWKADRQFEKMCPECWEKHLEEERQKANKEAERLAREMELPELIGSEKQIAWANTLRQNFIEKMSKIKEEDINDYKYYYKQELKEIKKNLGEEYVKLLFCKETLIIVRDYIIENKTTARFYIDNRNTDPFRYLLDYYDEAFKTDEEKAKEEMEGKMVKELKLESTVYPENKITNAVVEIIPKDDKITVRFEKNEEFRKIVKSLGYTWNSIWERKITQATGTVEDRAAELGNKLLNAGFPIMILDEEIRNNAINGLYEPECTNWIFKIADSDLLVIRWKGLDDKLYKAAKSLPGAYWNSGMKIKIWHYKEVEEFAELYGFKFSTGATKAIDEYKKSLNKVEVVTPVEVKEKENIDGLEKILESNSDILEDLKDD